MCVLDVVLAELISGRNKERKKEKERERKIEKRKKEKGREEGRSFKVREIGREKNNNTSRRAQVLKKANDVPSSRNWHNPCVCLHARSCGQENIF